MKIRTKAYLMMILMGSLFPSLYFFVSGQMSGLDAKITNAIIAGQIRDLVVEARRSEEDYLRTGNDEKINFFHADLEEMILLAQKFEAVFKREIPADSLKEMVRLAGEYQSGFKKIPDWKREIAAMGEKLDLQGIALEGAVTDAITELKREGAASASEPRATQVDKITLANKILKEGYGVAHLNAPYQSRPFGKVRSALLELSRRWHHDAMIDAASEYAASFQAFGELQKKMSDHVAALHAIAQKLEDISSENQKEMNRKRDETKEAMMAAILAAFMVCGFLVLSLSFWVTRVLSGPILRLRRAMLQISEGDLDAAIQVRSQDEIGELAESFRTMQGKLKDSYRDLRETNEKLADQTRELAQSNQELDRYSEELKKANSRLKKLDELKSNFMAAASHELKTPLTSIKGYVEMTLNGEAGLLNDEQREYLGYVKQSTDRLQRLLKELLDISKIESGRATLKRALTDLKILIKEEMVLFKAQAQEKGMALSMDVDLALKSIYCDPDKIREVLDNLLSNAIKYTPAHGEVKIISRNHPLGVEIAVRDNGIGVKKEDQERIFEPFQHLDQNGTEPREESTGLGLTLTKKIVRAHGGQIYVQSEEKRGATFTVILPLDMKQARLNEVIGQDL